MIEPHRVADDFRGSSQVSGAQNCACPQRCQQEALSSTQMIKGAKMTSLAARRPLYALTTASRRSEE